jgi:hypothetical protein
MSEILLDFESRQPYEIHAYMKELKTYMHEFFQSEKDLNHPAWTNWLDEFKIHYRTDDLTNQLWTKNRVKVEKGLNSFLKIGARFLLKDNKYDNAIKKLNAHEQYLVNFLGFTGQKVSSMIDIQNKHIFMLNHIDEDEAEPLIRAPGIDNKKYCDFVFFHELGHALFYDFMLQQNEKTHINLAGIYMLSQMLEKAENNTLKTRLKNTQHSMHEAFADLIGLYMMYHKNSLDKDDFFPTYRLFTARRRHATYGKEKIHDTTDVLDYLMDNMSLLKKDFTGFINDAFALSIAVTYEKLQQDIDSHEVMYNLARRVVSENYGYFYDLAVNEKVVQGEEFRNIIAHRHFDGHMQSTNYNMKEASIMVDYILQKNAQEIIRLKQLPDINQPARYDIDLLDNQINETHDTSVTLENDFNRKNKGFKIA